MSLPRLLVLFPLLVALPAHAAPPGPRVPQSASSGELSVTASGDQAQISGAFPLVLPFSLGGPIFGCQASGTATLDAVGDVIELRLESVTLGGVSASCKLRASAAMDDLELAVPDIGDAVTPVFGRVAVDSTLTGVVSEEIRSGSLGASYDSSLLGLPLDAPLDTLNAAVNGPALYLAGDTVSVAAGEMLIRWVASSGFGTVDATVVLETFVPPTGGAPAPASSASARIALAALLLAAAGLFGLRRRQRALQPGS